VHQKSGSTNYLAPISANLHRVAHKLAQAWMYLGHGHQILYEFIVPFNKFPIFTKKTSKVQSPPACVLRDITVLINKMLIKKRSNFNKKFSELRENLALKIMTEFPEKN